MIQFFIILVVWALNIFEGYCLHHVHGGLLRLVICATLKFLACFQGDGFLGICDEIYPSCITGFSVVLLEYQ